MSRNKYDWDEAKYKRFTKELRGRGEGKDYKPWLTTQDVPSSGRRTRGAGWKTTRLHHTLSDHETRYLYLLDWADNVIDIREQFPLIDLEVAQTIASDMGIKYPTADKSGFPYVLTTDFLITIQENGQRKDIARQIKPALELDKRTVIEKFEIERRYWAAKGIDWGIVTEHDMPRTLINNIEHFHPNYYLEPTADITLPEMYRIADLLKEKFRSSKQSIIEITSNLDNTMQLDSGTALRIFSYLVARKEILIDLSQKINLTKSAQSLVKLVSEKSHREQVA